MSLTFSKILVPLDGSDRSEHALSFAAALSQPGSSVVLLHVDVPQGATPAMVEAVIASQTGIVPIDDQDQVTGIAATAKRWAALFQGELTTQVVYGDPKTEILKAAGELKADLIVLATHARGGLGRLAFGSVADDLARSAVRPVLIFRAVDEEFEPAAASFKRIVFPYDGSELANTAKPAAASLAKERGLPVLVVAAYNPGPVGPISTGMDAAYPLTAYTELQDELGDLAKESAAKAVAYFQAAGLSATSVVHLGPVAMTITDELADGDLIVMTSHARGGLQRAILGSIAESLIHDGKAPILLVHPGDAAAAEG